MVLSALALLVGLTTAARPSATWTSFGSQDTQNPIEQQTPGGATQPDRTLWVVNHTGCAWDIDDTRNRWMIDGTLPSTESTGDSSCVVSDTATRGFAFQVFSPSPNLIVTLGFSPQSITFTPNPRPDPNDGRGYEYSVCVLGLHYDLDSTSVSPIPDSNSGVGVLGDAVFSITNPTDHAVRKIQARFGIAGSWNSSNTQCDVDVFSHFSGEINQYDPFYFWGMS